MQFAFEFVIVRPKSECDVKHIVYLNATSNMANKGTQCDVTNNFTSNKLGPSLRENLKAKCVQFESKKNTLNYRFFQHFYSALTETRATQTMKTNQKAELKQ